MALVQGSTTLEGMEEAGAAEDRTEGGNDFCHAYRCYCLETYSMIYT